MNNKYYYFVLTAVIFLAFLFSQDTLARYFWYKKGNARVALAINRSDTDLFMQLGNYFFGQTIGRNEYDLVKAEKSYKKALDKEPGILWGHYQLARIYFIRGRFEDALEEINKELEANAGNLRSLYIRGLIYGYRNRMGDLERAEEDFYRFTLWAPKEWAGYNDLAWIQNRRMKYKEAKETVERAFMEVAEADKNPWLWNSLGVSELNLFRGREAEDAFKNALKLANHISLYDWRQSYPGNDPSTAESGIEAFLKAIETNLERARGVHNLP